MPHIANQAFKKLFVRWNKKHQKAMEQLAKNPNAQAQDQVEWCRKHVEQYRAMMKTG